MKDLIFIKLCDIKINELLGIYVYESKIKILN